VVKSDAYQQTFIEFTTYQVFWDEPLNSSVELHISTPEAGYIAFIGSAPRLAEDVVCSSRLPSRLARRTRLGVQPRAAVGRLFLCPAVFPIGHPQKTARQTAVAIARDAATN
jgi:hypothetical protein